MYRADISIEILKYFGVWKPKYFIKKLPLIYNAFTFLIVSIIYVFTTSLFLHLILVKSNMDDFTEGLFYGLASSSTCVKIAITLLKHDEIMNLRNMLLEKKCRPQDKIECNIQEKFDNVARKVSITILTFASVATLINSLGPVLRGLTTILPFNSWTPFNLENRSIFWLTYFIQSLGATIAGFVTFAVDTFILVMMIQLCAQLEILMHRMQKFPLIYKEKDIYFTPQKQQIIFGIWIEHHEFMFRFGKNLNQIYSWSFFYQLFSATLDVCISTYLLAKENVATAKYWRMIFCLGAIMLQICIYCLPGNVVMEKSKDIGYAIYSMDWILLPNTSKLGLMHIMKRSAKPIIFKAGNIFPVTIETFTSILRMSFSLYNFLMQSS